MRRGWGWLKARFTFQGRATRLEYWTQTFLAVVLLFVAGAGIVLALLVIDRAISAHAGHPSRAIDNGVVLAGIPLLLADAVLYAWAVLAVAARRSHDVGRPLFSRVFGGFRSYWARGTIGPNQYGPDPLQKSAHAK